MYLLARFVSAALLVLGCSLAAPAAAQHDDEAHGLYQAGAAAFEEGRFDEALAYFQRAYDLSARPELLFNIGQAADRARRDDVAIAAFRSYLEARPDDPHRAQIEGRIRVLEREAEPEPVVESPPAVEEPAPTPAPSPTPADPIPAVADRSSGSPLALGLGIGGGVLAIGGAILLGLGVPDMEPPREGLLYRDEVARQDTADALTGTGAACIGAGLVLAAVALAVGLAPGPATETAWRVTPGGLRVAF